MRHSRPVRIQAEDQGRGRAGEAQYVCEETAARAENSEEISSAHFRQRIRLSKFPWSNPSAHTEIKRRDFIVAAEIQRRKATIMRIPRWPRSRGKCRPN